MARLELVEALQDLHERVLDEVVGVERAAGPGGQPAVGPALEPGKEAGEELFGGGLVTRVGAAGEDERRFSLGGHPTGLGSPSAAGL